jgi:hypothetical protein
LFSLSLEGRGRGPSGHRALGRVRVSLVSGGVMETRADDVGKMDGRGGGE